MSGISLSTLNSLSVEIYDPDGGLLNDPDASRRQIRIDGFRKQFPGGVMADGQMHALRKISREWLVRDADRVVMRHGSDIAYEGHIGDIGFEARGLHRIEIPLLGATEHHLMNWGVRHWFADNRVTDDAWVWETAATGAEKCTLDRNTRLRYTPKNVAWTTNQYASNKYVSPVGQTIRRITFDYQLQEGAQAWSLGVYNWASSSGIWSASTSGTGSADITLATPSNTLGVFLNSDANQTPASDGTIFGEIYNIKVYCTIGTLTSAITMETIARFSLEVYGTGTPHPLNPDTQYIQSPTTALTVEPFIWDDFYSLSDLLENIVKRGDGNQGRWAWQLLDSERAKTPDGLPVLELLPFPDTAAGYDYIIDFRSINMVQPPKLVLARSTLKNWIPVNYVNADGIRTWITPNDDASLMDTASRDSFGMRRLPGGLAAGEVSAAAALSYGQRLLASDKLRKWRMASIMVVGGYILDADGNQVPACMMEPGKRAKVTGGPVDENGEPPVVVITGIDYDHPTQTAAIATGFPFGPMQPRAAAKLFLPSELPEIEAVAEFESGGGGGGGGGKKKTNWKRKWGIPESEWGNWDPKSKGFWARRQAKIKAMKAKKKEKG